MHVLPVSRNSFLAVLREHFIGIDGYIVNWLFALGRDIRLLFDDLRSFVMPVQQLYLNRSMPALGNLHVIMSKNRTAFLRVCV